MLRKFNAASAAQPTGGEALQGGRLHSEEPRTDSKKRHTQGTCLAGWRAKSFVGRLRARPGAHGPKGAQSPTPRRKRDTSTQSSSDSTSKTQLPAKTMCTLPVRAAAAAAAAAQLGSRRRRLVEAVAPPGRRRWLQEFVDDVQAGRRRRLQAVALPLPLAVQTRASFPRVAPNMDARGNSPWAVRAAGRQSRRRANMQAAGVWPNGYGSAV